MTEKYIKKVYKINTTKDVSRIFINYKYIILIL